MLLPLSARYSVRKFFDFFHFALDKILNEYYNVDS